jgi:hypothetical protein
MKTLVSLGLLALLAGAASAAEDPMPYRLWWSFPRDDVSAIEIDEPDLHVSPFDSKWIFVSKVGSCDVKVAHRAMKRRTAGEGTPLRELRIESLDASGNVHDTVRCVMPLTSWRTRLGKALTERLEDELDAHMSFLVPRKIPKAPAAEARPGEAPSPPPSTP